MTTTPTLEELYQELEAAIVDRAWGSSTHEQPCTHGHYDCSSSYLGPCAAELEARLRAAAELELERAIDARVQRVLAIDREYRNAESSEQAAEREHAIEEAAARELVSARIRRLEEQTA